jgi:hypothetical protein
MHCRDAAYTQPVEPLGIMTREELPRVTTTLYDVIATLQTMVAPEDDALIVTIVTEWLRSGRLRVPRAVAVMA